MIAAVGHSHDLDSEGAIEEALEACSESLGGKTPQAGLLFAGIEHDHQALLDDVEARHPGLQLIGCTTHGELSSSGFAEDSVVLMLLHSEHVRFRAGVGEGTRKSPVEAARQAATIALEGLDGPVRLCIALPEGIGGVKMDAPGMMPTALLTSLSETLGRDVIVCGGMAGDQFRFTGTYQFCNGQVYSDAVPVLLMAGQLHVATGVASGWEPMGNFHRATAVDGFIVVEIDGEPPRDVWMRYFGSVDLSGPRNAFAVYPDEGGGQESDEFYLCVPARFQKNGTMVTMNPVVPGARIRFTAVARDQVLEGAAASAEKALAAFPGASPEAALIFSCAGRSAVLGTRVDEETGRLQEPFEAPLPAVGFYTYGEICPLPASPTPFSHNCTFVTVLIGEDA